MKKLKKSHKILLGSSAALLTLVPIIAVAATSCSNQTTSNDHSNVHTEPNKPLPPAKPVEILVSTNAEQVQMIINSLSKTNSLIEIDKILSPNTLLSSLGLNPQFASVNYNKNLVGDHIEFSVQLGGNYQFNPTLMHQNLSGVVITPQTLEFSVPTDGVILDDVHNYYFSIPKLEAEITTIGQIKTVSEYDNVNTKTNNLYTALNISPQDVEIVANNGSPIVSPSQTVATKTLSFTTKNGKKFALDFVNSLQSLLTRYGINTVSLSSNAQTLTVANIPTSYVLDTKIPLTVSATQLTNLKNYLLNLINVHSANAFVNQIQSNIAKLLNVASGYLTIHCNVNDQATNTNKSSTYDLTISPASGCEWKNISANLVKVVFESSGIQASFVNNTIHLLNVKTGIYNQTKTLATINSSALNADNLTSLNEKIKQLETSHQLVTTLNKVLGNSALPNNAVFVQAKNVSGNNNQVEIILANPFARQFDIITINLTPSTIDPTIFGANTAKISSNLNDFSSAIVPNCVLNNTELESDKISTSNFALNGITGPVNQEDALSSSNVAAIMKTFSSVPNVSNWVKEEIMHYAFVQFSNLAGFANLGSLSATNSFTSSSLKIINQNGELVANGNLGFELFNNGTGAVHINANNPLLLNSEPITLAPGQYVAVGYTFSNSQLKPMFVNNSELNKVDLTYGFSNVTHHLITFDTSKNTYTDSTSTAPVTNLVGGLSNLLDVTLSNVSNTSNYYNPQTQKVFNNYLSSLTKETISSQLTVQDDNLWKFIQIAGKDVGQIFTVLGTNPTLGEFFNALSGPLTDMATELTGNKDFGQLIGDILSNKTVIQYWNDNKAEIFKIISTLSNNPMIKAALNSIMSKVNSKLPSGVRMPSFVALNAEPVLAEAPATQPSAPSTPSQPVNLANSLKELITAYTKTADFKTLVNKVLAMVAHPTDSILNKQSLLEIIGEDLQPILQSLCDQTKDTQSQNPIWQLLNSILEMLNTIEKNQTDDQNNSIFNLRLFDILLNKAQTDAIINFCKNGLEPFLQKVNPTAVAPLQKALGLMTKIFNGTQVLHLANPSDIFAALSQIYIDGQSSPITWEELFQKYISCTPTVDVKSYDPQNHTVTYNNILDFAFKNTASINFTQIKHALGNITVQTLCSAFGVDLNQILDKLPSAVWWVADKSMLLNIKVANLLPDKFEIKAGDGAKCIMTEENVQLNPTVVNGQATWWTNAPMIIKFHFKNSADGFIQAVITNVENAVHPAISKLWWGMVVNLIDSAGKSAMKFADGYLEGQFNFSVGWVNKINTGNLQNYKVYDYNRNVENSQYKIIESTSRDNAAITKILTDPKYYKDLSSIQTDLSGKYIFDDDPALNQAIIAQLVDTAQTTWLTDPNLASSMKPSVMVQFMPNNEFHLNLDIKIGFIKIPIHKNFNIPGKFIISLKLPTPVPVSADGGKTYKLTDTITYSLPYSPIKESTSAQGK